MKGSTMLCARSLGVVVVSLIALGCSKSGETGGPSRPPPTGNGRPGLPSVPGRPETPRETPLLPRLSGCTSSATGDRVAISVIPVEGARDYRVYVLPKDDAITATSDGFLTVTNATYRCGGDRQAATIATDDGPTSANDFMMTYVEHMVDGYRRTMPEATLGHVYVQPGDGR